MENVPVFTTRTDDDLAASRPPLRQPKHSLIHKQKRDEKGKGGKKKPLNQKTERKKLLNWINSQKAYTRERAEIARDKRKGKDRKAYWRANESS
jgi:hypothetical protein